MVFIDFLGSQPGRVVRVVAGGALIATGILLGGGWLTLSVVGLVPLAAGAFDFCLLGPIFRLPFVGSKFRAARGVGTR